MKEGRTGRKEERKEGSKGKAGREIDQYTIWRRELGRKEDRKEGGKEGISP
jgi:hypothetical protein